MATNLSKKESILISHILDQATDELKILLCTLHEHDFTFFNLEESVQHSKKKLAGLIDIVEDTSDNIKSSNNFEYLSDFLLETFEKKKFDDAIMLDKEAYEAKLKKLNKNLGTTTKNLMLHKNAGRRAVWEHILNNTTDTLESESSRELHQAETSLKETERDYQRWFLHKESKIVEKNQNWEFTIDNENRCTEEVQTYFKICRQDLLNDFEETRTRHEEIMNEKLNKIQHLRRDKEKFEQDSIKCEELIIQRAEEMENWREKREEISKELDAIRKIQKWWRQFISTRPQLLGQEIINKLESVRKNKK